MEEKSQKSVSVLILGAVLAALTGGSAPWWVSMLRNEQGSPSVSPEPSDAKQADASAPLYTAELGCGDHRNSNGEALHDAAMIVRQDRANYYEFGVHDPGDTSDRRFESKSAREALQNRLQLSPEQARIILTKTPTIRLYENAAGYYVSVVSQGAGQATCL